MRERLSAAQAARIGLLAASILGLLGTGCVVHHHHGDGPVVVKERGHGPPPHAPAHGYRHKHAHDSVELVFDGALGVYVVVGRTGVYWHGDRYLELRNGHWRASARIDGGWVSIGHDAVPVRLVAKHEGGGHGKHSKHGKHGKHGKNHPAKHGR
jgi:hypothetical protein